MVKDQVLEDIINAKNGYLGTGWTLESVRETYDGLLEARFYRMGEGIVLNDTYDVLDKECLKLTGKKLNEWIGINKDRVR